MAFTRSSSRPIPPSTGAISQLHTAPHAALVTQSQTDSHRRRIGDDLGRVASQVEVIPGLSQRLVETIDDLLDPRAERRVVIVGGTCSQLQTQLHRQTTLQQEDGLAVLIANPVKNSRDNHGVQPPLQPRRRHTSIRSVVADEPPQMADITGQLLDIVSHRGPPAVDDAEPPNALRTAW